jgi:hypothetical protein
MGTACASKLRHRGRVSTCSDPEGAGGAAGARRTLTVVAGAVQRSGFERRRVTPLQTVLAGGALAIDATLAIAFTVIAWPVGAVFLVFPLSVGGVLATTRRGRFRGVVGVTAVVHIVTGLLLFFIGGLVLVASGALLVAAAIAPSPEGRDTRWARTRGHAVMLFVAALVLLALAPWVAGLGPD